MPDPLFQELYSDTERLLPAPVEQVQARGRQRSRRQRAAMLAAVLVVAVPLGAVVAVDRGGPQHPVGIVESGPPTPSAIVSGSPPVSLAPSASSRAPKALKSVPAGAMLTAADAGGTGWKAVDDPGGDWAISAWLGLCPSFDVLAEYPQGTDQRARDLTRGDARISQLVTLHPAGRAVKEIEHLRKAVTACQQFTDAESGARYAITQVAEGFAGPHSMLVKGTLRGGTSASTETSLWVVVAEQTLTSQTTVPDGSEATARQLGAQARTRLCQALGYPC